MGLLHQKEDFTRPGDDYEKDSGEKHLNSSTNGNGDSPTMYYSVYVPHALEQSSDKLLETSHVRVYADRDEALITLKANKKARLKVFNDEEAAIEFSLNGSDTTTKVECPNLPSSPIVVLSEGSTYKGPKSQELVKFRKAIEKHDFTYVVSCIEENPRYLISSGDTPQILQEGSRYNALHVAAKANNAQVAKYICETVKSVEFMNKLYGGAKSNLADRGSIMLDLYLNTPDKGSNETPLHFASKLGALEVVQVLVSYEQCDRQRRNKFDETAKDLVCSRVTGSGGSSVESGLKKDILFALADHYYVAVLRSPDNAVAPTIPDPFSPSSPPTCLHRASTPTKTTDVYPPLMVTGVAGPMTASEASTFRKKWKTPPRKLVFDSQAASPIKTDPDKGFERVGRALASDFKVQWKEYWAFLGEFVDFSSSEGLEKLESHLSNLLHSRQPKEKTPEKPCLSQNNVVSPVTDLCNNFKTLSIVDDRPKVSPHCLDHSSSVFATRLALSIPRGASSSIQEIDKYQDFLAACSNDTRFSQEDLSTAHSRLAALVYSKLSTCSEGKSCSALINSLLSNRLCGTPQSIKSLKCVLKFVEENSNGRAALTSCDCPLRTNPESHKFNFAEIQRCVRNLTFSNHDSDAEFQSFDDSDDDDDFFTPPGSPVNDEVEEEDDFSAACDSFEVFIDGGSRPSKTDFDVYRSIGNALPNIAPSEYPTIYLWSVSISKHLSDVGE